MAERNRFARRTVDLRPRATAGLRVPRWARLPAHQRPVDPRGRQQLLSAAGPGRARLRALPRRDSVHRRPSDRSNPDPRMANSRPAVHTTRHSIAIRRVIGYDGCSRHSIVMVELPSAPGGCCGIPDHSTHARLRRSRMGSGRRHGGHAAHPRGRRIIDAVADPGDARSQQMDVPPPLAEEYYGVRRAGCTTRW